ncbi:MAG: hypothetical protein HUU06_12520, partial [Planctomycetaceae bacterium]|nr:hypothetical protein [Planctomycetaceae bacterium]
GLEDGPARAAGSPGDGSEPGTDPRLLPSLAGLPPVLDADGAALLLRLASGREALRLARRRVLPSVKIGRRTLFLLSSLLDTLKSRERPAIEDRDLNRAARRGTVL